MCLFNSQLNLEFKMVDLEKKQDKNIQWGSGAVKSVGRTIPSQKPKNKNRIFFFSGVMNLNTGSTLVVNAYMGLFVSAYYDVKNNTNRLFSVDNTISSTQFYFSVGMISLILLMVNLGYLYSLIMSIKGTDGYKYFEPQSFPKVDWIKNIAVLLPSIFFATVQIRSIGGLDLFSGTLLVAILFMLIGLAQCVRLEYLFKRNR